MLVQASGNIGRHSGDDIMVEGGTICDGEACGRACSHTDGVGNREA